MSSSLLNRIRALFAKANDASVTPAESEAFAAKANELLLKHKLSPADLELPGEVAPSVGAELLDMTALLGVNGAKLPLWGQSLANGIATTHFCRLVRVTPQHVALYGLPEDRAIFRFLLTTLVQHGKSAARRYAIATRSGRRGSNSFLLGFQSGIAKRLRAMRAEVEQQGGKYALVTLRKSDALVEQAVAAAHPQRKRSARRINADDASYAAGRAAAEKASLHRPVGPATQPGRLLGA